MDRAIACDPQPIAEFELLRPPLQAREQVVDLGDVGFTQEDGFFLPGG
jgi:hypothetical protein